MNEDEILTPEDKEETVAEGSVEPAPETCCEPETEDSERAEIPEQIESEEQAEETERGEEKSGYGDNAACAAEDEPSSLTDEQRRRILANPMFYTFAKGKAMSLDELISEFSEMLALGGEQKLTPMARTTPTSGVSSPDYALSERQRRIARDAGMSYREYYKYLKTMKTK